MWGNMNFGGMNFGGMARFGGFDGFSPQQSYMNYATQLGMNTAQNIYGGFGSNFGMMGTNSFGAGFGNNLGTGFGMMNPMAMMGMGGFGGMGGVDLSNISTSLVANNPYMSADSQIAFLDAKYGHLFNMGLQMNPQKIMPMLWKAQSGAINQYFDYMIQRNQAQQQQQAQAQQPKGIMKFLPDLLPAIIPMLSGGKFDFSQINFSSLLSGMLSGGGGGGNNGGGNMMSSLMNNSQMMQQLLGMVTGGQE